jgi:hypothetical protein
MSTKVPTKESLDQLLNLLRRYLLACQKVWQWSKHIEPWAPGKPGSERKGHDKSVVIENPYAQLLALERESSAMLKSAEFMVPYGWPREVCNALGALQSDDPVSRYRGDRLFQACERLDCKIKAIADALPESCSSGIEAPPGRNDARNAYCYNQRKNGRKLGAILREVNSTEGWKPLTTTTSVSDAADAHAKMNKLPIIRKQKRN